RDFDALDAAASRPGETGDLTEARPGQLLPARRACDDGLGIHLERELPGRAIRQEIGIFRRLVLRHVGLIYYFDAAQPLHVGISFPAWDHQPERIALLRTDRLAILSEGDQHIVDRFLQRDAALHVAGVGALGDDPGCAGLDA